MLQVLNRLLYRTITFIAIILSFWISTLISEDKWSYDKSLTPDIQFWKEIFTQYKTNQYILHDAENLSIIYKIVTFDSTISEYYKEKQLERIKKEIKNILLRYAGGRDSTGHQTFLEKHIWEQYVDVKNPLIYKRAANQIRAQQGMRENFAAGLGRSLIYIPIMKGVFRNNGLPEELAYLPHIESSFNPLARSKAGAAGMWQFMRSTARRYMKVNRIIDQRYDPIISTQAAAKLLQYNYEQTGNWGLAITAYNFGLAGIKNAIKKYGPDYLKVRESFNHRKFKFASRNFFPEFLAVIEIMEEYRKYFPDIKPIHLEPSMCYQLKAYITLPLLVKQLQISMSEFKSLNPIFTRRAIKGWVKVPAGYWVNLPLESNLAKLDSYFRKNHLELTEKSLSSNRILNGNHTKIVSGTDKVQKPHEIDKVNGSLTLKKPGVVSEASMKTFSLSDWEKAFIYTSKKDIISVDDIKNELYKIFRIENNYIIVFANETLGHYADWLKISLSNLQRINRLGRRRTIYQGQKLKLDFRRVSREEFQQKRLNYHIQLIMSLLDQKELVNLIDYEIREGESVWELAKYRYQVPLEVVQYFNLQTDINRLYPGDIVRIPIFQINNTLEETL